MSLHPPQLVVINKMSSLSPESVPSLAEISHISKDDSSFHEQSNESDLSRKIFRESKLQESQKWTTMIADITLPFRTCEGDDSEPIHLTERSEDSLDFNDEVLPRIHSMIQSSRASFEETSLKLEDTSSVEVESPHSPPVPIKRILSETFNTFDGCVQTSSVLDDFIPVSTHLSSLSIKDNHPFDEIQTWTEESKDSDPNYSSHSEREETLGLKEIHISDSMSVTKLQSEVESMKSFNHRLLSTIKQLTSDMKSSSHRIETLVRKNDELKDRESAHLDTIAILKNEVDRLTMSKTVLESKQENLAQLETENELFASQIVEYEHEISKAKRFYESKENDVANLKKENKLFASQIIEYENDLVKAKSSYESEMKVQEDLQVELERMNSKMATMEKQEILLTEQFGSKVMERDALIVHYRHKMERIEAEIQGLRESVSVATQEKKRKEEEENDDQVKMLSQLAELDQELEQHAQTLKQRDLEIEELRGAIRKDTIETPEKEPEHAFYAVNTCGTFSLFLPLGMLDQKWF